jgi:ClpP class serine protease
LAEDPHLSISELDPVRLLAALTHRVEAGLSNRVIALLPEAAGNALSFAKDVEETEPSDYVVDLDGMATVTIAGPLMQRAVEMCGVSVADGYDSIARRASRAFSSEKVSSVLLDVDSPGGDCAGCPELADALRAMADESGKPLHVRGSEMIASAAYWLASAADHISIPRTGHVGSIGTIVMGMNRHGAMAAAGVRVLIAASPRGKLLAGASSLLDPDDAERMAALANRMQGRADEITALFAADVAKRRRMSVDAILALDAQMFGGEAAITSGLADSVSSRAVAEARLKASVKRRTYSMDEKHPEPQAAQTALAARSQEEERLLALGRSIEALTGQQGAAAEELTRAWRDAAARIPTLERRVKIEALQGRLAQAYPPSARFALGDTGLPDPKAGPHETFDAMSLDVFDARTSHGTIHPALSAPPAPKAVPPVVLSLEEQREAARSGLSTEEMMRAKIALLGGVS